VGRPLVGQEPARGHHLERSGLCFHVDQPGRGVDPDPVVDGVKNHAGAYLAQEHLPGLRRRRGAPAEFGGQHLPAGGADPGQFAGRAGAVGEHGDGLGDDDVEGIAGEGERADVARPDRDPAVHAGGAGVGFGAFQHERRDVHRGDLGAEAAGDLDRGGRYPAADVEHPAGGCDAGAGEQGLRGCPAARVDDSFPDGGHELVRVQGRYLAGR